LNFRTLLMVPGVVAFAGANSFVADLGPTINPPVRPAGLEAHDTHAAASLLGQFRTSISSWMYLRADLYLHNGVEMRMLSAGEIARGRTGVGSEEDGHDKLHNDLLMVTVIPERERDFRGIFGEVERATSAYKDMTGHGHNDPEEALPLFRLMTWLDPQFINGWTVGASIIGRRRDDQGTRQAIAYLQEGLRHNPQSIDILSQIGYYHVTRRHDLKSAAAYMDRARLIGFPLRQRLSDAESEALLQAYRWLILCYRDLGRYNERWRVLQEALTAFPEDPLLIRFQQQPPSILTVSAQEVWKEERYRETREAMEAAGEEEED
jgi:hypothetical protein